MKVVSDGNRSYKTCKAPVISSPPTNQQPARYRPDALPVAQPTVTETLKEKLLFCSKSGPNVPVTQQVHDGTEM